MEHHDMIIRMYKLLDAITVTSVKSCQIVAEIYSMLQALDEGIMQEQGHHRQEVELLSKQIEKLTTTHPEEGEQVVGGEVYHLGDQEIIDGHVYDVGVPGGHKKEMTE